MKNRFQKLAGIKPLYESNHLNEQEIGSEIGDTCYVCQTGSADLPAQSQALGPNDVWELQSGPAVSVQSNGVCYIDTPEENQSPQIFFSPGIAANTITIGSFDPNFTAEGLYWNGPGACVNPNFEGDQGGELEEDICYACTNTGSADPGEWGPVITGEPTWTNVNPYYAPDATVCGFYVDGGFTIGVLNDPTYQSSGIGNSTWFNGPGDCGINEYIDQEDTPDDFGEGEWDPSLEGCGNFNNLPSNMQSLACEAYANLPSEESDPNLTMWVQNGNCCQDGTEEPQDFVIGGSCSNFVSSTGNTWEETSALGWTEILPQGGFYGMTCDDMCPAYYGGTNYTTYVCIPEQGLLQDLNCWDAEFTPPPAGGWPENPYQQGTTNDLCACCSEVGNLGEAQQGNIVENDIEALAKTGIISSKELKQRGNKPTKLTKPTKPRFSMDKKDNKKPAKEKLKEIIRKNLKNIIKKSSTSKFKKLAVEQFNINEKDKSPIKWREVIKRFLDELLESKINENIRNINSSEAISFLKKSKTPEEQQQIDQIVPMITPAHVSGAKRKLPRPLVSYMNQQSQGDQRFFIILIAELLFWNWFREMGGFEFV